MTPRGDADSFPTGISSRFLPSSRTNDTPVSSKEDSNREERKTGHGARTSPSLFGRVSDNTHTVWRVPKGIDLEAALPPLSRFHPDSDANRGQLWRCVPSPYPRLTASTSIEITLIYCGTERLARSIIRLSPVGR